jgi:multiple sugar transport system substrate-binding protein
VSLRVVTRRSAIGALAGAGLAYAVLGPRSAGRAPAGRLVLDYWEKWTGHEAAAMQRIVDAYNAAQDRVFVRCFFMGAVDQKTTIAIAGNDPPALAGLWDFALPAFVESRAVICVDHLEREFGPEVRASFAERTGIGLPAPEASRYAAPVWAALQHPLAGSAVVGGLPTTTSTMALYFSKDAFRRAGLDPDTPPTTIDELDAMAERLTTFRTDGSVERSGFIHREPGWWNWLWGYSFGGSLYEANAERATVDTAANRAAFEWVQSYPTRFGVQRLVSFQSGFGGYSSAQQALLSGKVAMTLHGPFLANVINTFRPDFQYGVCAFPVTRGLYDAARPVGLLEADVLCVPRGCRHPREAYEFMLFTQQQRHIEALATAHAKPSPLAEVSESFLPNHPNKAAALHNVLLRSPRAFTKPRTRAWPQIEAEFNAQIAGLWSLSRPAADILAEIQERSQAAIDTAVRRRTARYGVPEGIGT